MCPFCTVQINGTCDPCNPDIADHPACKYCKDGVYSPPPVPWYKTDLAVSITVSVVAAVASAMILEQIRRRK